MLRVEQVDAAYGRVPVLHGVSLRVEPGEIVSILGANGAGKTTLFRVISGLLRPSAGRVVLEGREISRLPAYQVARLGVGQVPEGRQVFRGLTVQDNLRLGGYYGSAADGRRDRSVAEGLRRVYDLFPILEERRLQSAGTLSGGQQQMLAIGRALMTRPRLLLLDEPSLGLAPLLVAEVFRVIQDLHQQGQTVLLIEQNAYAALRISHRAYVVEQGRIGLEGPAAEVLGDENVKHLYLGKQAVAGSRVPGPEC
jgi:branched-chain amino acid transport system ATP-binding protein